MKKIAVKRSDGGVSIIIPSQDATPELLERDARAVEGYVSHRYIDDEIIPRDRTFRDAWTDNNPVPTIDVDMPRARTIHMNHLRQLRAKKLPKLDEDYLKADEDGNVQLKQKIAKMKKDLRDMPQNYDLSGATTPTQLKELIPDLLKD